MLCGVERANREGHGGRSRLLQGSNNGSLEEVAAANKNARYMCVKSNQRRANQGRVYPGL